MFGKLRGVLGWTVVSLSMGLVGCGSKPLNRAPVEDRGTAASPRTAALDPNTPPVKQPPGFENAGKPGYYTVKPGDGLIRIGLDSGQNYKDIARWNALENPNKIEVGQVLRVIPPIAAETGAVAKPVGTAAVTAAPLPSKPSSATDSKPAEPKTGEAKPTDPKAADPKTAEAKTADTKPADTKPAAGAAAAGDDEPNWMWPGKGPVLAGFDEVKNKGLDIGGAAGDPVLAAADGRVVYSGAGLRGYGNLIILKHNNTYLTAYAHNQTLLVKEDQNVKRGQKIAEMGNSDADRVKLHFEVRRQGKPVDPSKYLPNR
ncbi:peptidoglycan DD-metalloendopeptidase family protein [Rhodoferax aquaticus]|uniref:LysM peptidoglycan-binding domain-containing protein n=1 Tax=Rhodoferax aquaticus TaxID=2527691 RepID=A0A515ENC6_9BURK|nr:peptidoglycan DD-metalloendopeptidase family protein [Rhodoferax aquaticus]QDL54170.1 LysM peptidoglycan-binding domain-containing protein [Rhodoferax aquaticus]